MPYFWITYAVFMKLTIFSVLLTFLIITELIHSLMTTYGWKYVRSWNRRKEDVQSGKSPSGKCLVGEVSVNELYFGEVSVYWDLFIRKSQSGNCPYTNLLWTFLRETALKSSSKKEQWPAPFLENPVGKAFSLSKLLTGLQFLKEW